ncbi:uncharacterized protein LOC143775187 [Ranitomeya variabilis]|uniref:uncharacterized protein LOC143775187 n=1 Tax=Ranitomeya variabilis TaxID=490064 RepID=UPI0040565503
MDFRRIDVQQNIQNIRHLQASKYSKMQSYSPLRQKLPGAMNTAPRARHAAPGSMHASPRAMHAAPRAMYPAPVAMHAAPGAMHASPRAMHAAPRALYPAPVAMHASPRAMHASPRAMHASPGAMHASPRAMHAAPRALLAAPGDLNIIGISVSKLGNQRLDDCVHQKASIPQDGSGSGNLTWAHTGRWRLKPVAVNNAPIICNYSRPLHITLHGHPLISCSARAQHFVRQFGRALALGESESWWNYRFTPYTILSRNPGKPRSLSDGITDGGNSLCMKPRQTDISTQIRSPCDNISRRKDSHHPGLNDSNDRGGRPRNTVRKERRDPPGSMSCLSCRSASCPQNHGRHPILQSRRRFPSLCRCSQNCTTQDSRPDASW